MCGIFFSLVNAANNEADLTACIDFEAMKRRGPDSFELRSIDLNDQRLLFAASVLSLRGGPDKQVTVQPLIDEATGNVLLWNGEIFDSRLVRVELEENDAVKLFDKLNRSKREQILEIIESIEGPYAFVYFNSLEKCVYFGRDRFGRRSLLISAQDVLTLCSVRVDRSASYQELKANGVYMLDLNTTSKEITLFPWRKRVDENRLIDDSYLNNVSIRISPDLYLKDELAEFNENEREVSQDESMTTADRLVDEFYQVLESSVRRRVENVPSYCKKCSRSDKRKFDSELRCDHAKVAVLFSGGVDSAVVAALVDKCLPPDQPIDLLNIAFEQASNKQSNTGDRYSVPDRLSGRETLKELNPNRKWNFVEVNVTLDELRTERERHIKHLIYPHQTVLDDSIGCALWFASRGQGVDDNQSFSEVLFVGMGADEQLGGYVRHRTRYEKEGMRGLCGEVRMEIERISDRNLGRDDRILSDHGILKRF